jgi:hypothetical protein
MLVIVNLHILLTIGIVVNAIPRLFLLFLYLSHYPAIDILEYLLYAVRRTGLRSIVCLSLLISLLSFLLN